MEPKPLTLTQLESKHPEYTELAPVWRTIDTLRQGFPAIKRNVQQFIPKRPVEDDELYSLRTAKLSYTPVMGHVVHTYTGKMAMAGVDFPEEAGEVWSAIRKSNAAPTDIQRDEVTFLSEVLTHILYFGRSFVMVDTPAEAAAKRSKRELLQSKLIPYFTTISPLEVISWGDNWYVRKQYIANTEPFSEVSTFALYTYIGKDVTVKYRIPVQLALVQDCDGNSCAEITKVLWRGEWLKPDDDVMRWEPEVIPGVGTDRLVPITVSEDKWLCLSIYNKQIQHLRIENAWTDAGYLSGTVQRVFTPPDPMVMDDPRVAYDNTNVAKELEKAGNAHILIGKGYSFVESSGTALGNLEQMLDKIEAQILKIANLSFISGDKTTLQQSGVSKKLDRDSLEGTLQEYGNILIDTYNTLLAKVAKLLSIPAIEVSGLSDFSELDPQATLETIALVANMTDFPLVAKIEIYRKLLKELEVVMTEEQDKILDRQLASIKQPEPVNPSVVDTNGRNRS